MITSEWFGKSLVKQWQTSESRTKIVLSRFWSVYEGKGTVFLCKF